MQREIVIVRLLSSEPVMAELHEGDVGNPPRADESPRPVAAPFAAVVDRSGTLKIEYVDDIGLELGAESFESLDHLRSEIEASGRRCRMLTRP